MREREKKRVSPEPRLVSAHLCYLVTVTPLSHAPSLLLAHPSHPHHPPSNPQFPSPLTPHHQYHTPPTPTSPNPPPLAAHHHHLSLLFSTLILYKLYICISCSSLLICIPYTHSQRVYSAHTNLYYSTTIHIYACIGYKYRV